MERNERMPWSASDLGKCYWTMGKCRVANGRYDLAQTVLSQAYVLQQGLLSDYPDDSAFIKNLANTCIELGVIQEHLGSHSMAIKYLEEACALREDLMKRSTNSPETLSQAVSAYGLLAKTCETAGRGHAAAMAREREFLARTRLEQLSVAVSPR